MRSDQKANALSLGVEPAISLPKGGGAIEGIGEKFGSNPVTGTGRISVPIATSASRLAPSLALSYDSGRGNGDFGLGWSLSIGSITRKTDKGVPQYRDSAGDESDVFILGDAEDLVPALTERSGSWEPEPLQSANFAGVSHQVRRYRPRIEAQFSRIERWTSTVDGTAFWKVVTGDNVASYYGIDHEGRISDPSDPTRIFTWLLQRTVDDKGNVTVFAYKAEDRVNLPDAPHEVNRNVGAKRYLKAIRYGNVEPYYPGADAAMPGLPLRWHFHVVFDFGEHAGAVPSLEENGAWPARQDAFSQYRSGFEIRTYRLCRRVLMFHEFAELGATPCLVKSTDFTYDENPVASLLRLVRHTSYRRNSPAPDYTSRSLPSLELSYSEARIDDTVHVVGGDSLDHLPHGVDEAYQWLDLDSEGAPGILTRQGGGWFYKRNVSNRPAAGATRAAFAPVQLVTSQPSFAGGQQRFLDLSGGGQQCLTQFDRPMAGYFARSAALEWEPFTPFERTPGIDFANPNLRMIDLDGDGLEDILICDDEVLTWHVSLGKQGFGPAQQVPNPGNDNTGPELVFADRTQSVYLADMSGGGLTDLVRIRHDEVCYWPSLGYGRFGRKITMSNAPSFDAAGDFNPERVRLADIDGSGTADIIYLGARAVAIYANLSGNALAPARMLERLPAPDNLAAVTAVDLLANGTACLVWSSPLPGDAGRQMRYVDLMGGVKPYLLTGTTNNLGAETRVHYAASTRFYLQDRLDGRPWITRLPFPVHVVERIETLDAISRTRFTSRFAYHHGYFDAAEREFRGFGMVEQWDTEAFAALADHAAVNLDAATALPPVLTRSWFHTGAFLGGAGISRQFRDEYYREPRLDQAALDAMLLPDTLLPPGLTIDEEREACRALKGSPLRQEIYALDGTALEAHPYLVTEANFTIKRVQPRGRRHAVFFTHAREKVDYHYERALYEVNGEPRCDPRVSHAITLAVDEFGNVQRAVTIGYGRRFDSSDALLTADDRTRQKKICVASNEASFTNTISSPQAFRAPLPAESRTFELLNIVPQASVPGVTNLFRFAAMEALVAAAGDGAHEIGYEDVDGAGATGTAPFRRLIGESRTLYRRDDLAGALQIAELHPLALPFEHYQLALTPGVLSIVDAKISAAEATTLLVTEGRYRDLDGDGRLWVPSGRVLLSPDPANPDAAFARAHRYLPQGHHNVFDAVSRVEYDSHQLFVARTIDPIGNTLEAEFDYRVMQPRQVTDANGNRSAVAFDVLGLVVATAVMGKAQEPDGSSKGDLLQGFSTDPSAVEIDAFVTDPLGQAAGLLGQATSRIIYDVGRFQRTGEPAFAATILREKHVTDLEQGEDSPLQVALSYSDGFARHIQNKMAAEPGALEPGGAIADPRWVASGWTIFNNKGKPVRQYQPFFTATHRFEFAVLRGVSATLFYDPLGRAIATLHPDHGYEKVRFDPWWQQSWDANDTVLLDPLADRDVAAWFGKLEASEHSPTWHALRMEPLLAAARWPDAAERDAESDAAQKAAAHANTPGTTHLDSLGRAFLTIADNGPGGTFATRTRLDVEGNVRATIDALDRVVETRHYALRGASLHHASMEAGQRWVLYDAAGTPLRSWDARGHRRRTECDTLRRPLREFVLGADPQDPLTEMLVGRVEYGEDVANAAHANLRTRPFRKYDGAGIVTHERYDFKGNLLESSARFVAAHDTVPNWLTDPPLQPAVFTNAFSYDALNRNRAIVSPDASVYRAAYNRSGLLTTIAVNLRGASAATPFVDRIDYDALGQRTRIEYHNGVTTEYRRDPLTFRLTRLTTTRGSDDARLQDLQYTHDPAGNVTRIRDDAQQAAFFNNQVVRGDNDYRYDALYRLVGAEGREHIGQLSQPQLTWDDAPRGNGAQPGDPQAMRRYHQAFHYDAVGNFLQLIHQAVNGNWRRDYLYQEASEIEPGKHSNRLTMTNVGAVTDVLSTQGDGYDAHGNLRRMPHLARMEWDFRDQLRVVDLGGGGKAFYIYDASGHRVRKVVERNGGARVEERLYLGGFEIYTERVNGAVSLERATLHVMDDHRRIALVETRTQGIDGSPAQLIRFQFENHLGSASLELDDDARIICYEEYYPYGSTSYQARNASINAAAKRYRYAGKERDEETGFTRHGVRYCAPWLGRWTSCDPIGVAGGINLYRYAHANPVMLSDPGGRNPRRRSSTRPKPRGNLGDVNTHGGQGTRGKGTPTVFESEHLEPFAVQRANMTNPATGQSPVPEGRGGTFDKAQPTVMLNKADADAKTALDRPVIRSAQQGAGNPVASSVADDFGPDAGLARARAGGANIPIGAEAAAIGQTDAKHANDAIRAFSRDPINNPLIGSTADEVCRAVDTTIDLNAHRTGNFSSLAGTKDSAAKTLFKGVYSEVPDVTPQFTPAPEPPPPPAPKLTPPSEVPSGGGWGKTLGSAALTGLWVIGTILAVKGTVDDVEEEDYFGAALNVGSIASAPTGIVSGAYHILKAETMAYGAILKADEINVTMYAMWVHGSATAEDVIAAGVDISTWNAADRKQLYEEYMGYDDY